MEKSKLSGPANLGRPFLPLFIFPIFSQHSLSFLLFLSSPISDPTALSLHTHSYFSLSLSVYKYKHQPFQYFPKSKTLQLTSFISLLPSPKLNDIRLPVVHESCLDFLAQAQRPNMPPRRLPRPSLWNPTSSSYWRRYSALSSASWGFWPWRAARGCDARPALSEAAVPGRPRPPRPTRG